MFRRFDVKIFTEIFLFSESLNIQNFLLSFAEIFQLLHSWYKNHQYLKMSSNSKIFSQTTNQWKVLNVLPKGYIRFKLLWEKKNRIKLLWEKKSRVKRLSKKKSRIKRLWKKKNRIVNVSFLTRFRLRASWHNRRIWNTGRVTIVHLLPHSLFHSHPITLWKRSRNKIRSLWRVYKTFAIRKRMES